MEPRAINEPRSPLGKTFQSGARASELATRLEPLQRALGQVIRGKDELLASAVTCLIAGGHLLLEDVPGTGKTTLARALAAASGLRLQRVQMTSDLLPQDLTGASYPVAQNGSQNGAGPGAGLDSTPSFRFIPGPIFSDLLLADELNRTPPRTQSALLEAMAERAVTVEGTRHALPWPFFVIATQNPTEFAGTFPLPESQLDRFMMRLTPGYPSRSAERALLHDRRGTDPLAEAERQRELRDRQDDGADSVRAAIRDAMGAVDEVVVAEPILDYILDLVAATRGGSSDDFNVDPSVSSGPMNASPLFSPLFFLGASPRAALDLDRAARARALLDGRDFVLPEDVYELLIPVLAHRLIPAESGFDGQSSPEALLRQVLGTVKPPRLNADGDIER